MTAAAEMPDDILHAAEECVIHLSEIKGETRWLLRGLISTAILADRQRDQWQPIDTIPLGEYVLIFRGAMGAEVFRAEDEFWREAFEFDTDEPTHWQPIPSAPKGGAE